MTTRLSHDLTYDAPMADVHAMLMDPAFREQVCDAQETLSRTVTVTDEDAGSTVLVDQVQTAQGIPSFAKKFIGDEINIVQTERWSDDEHAELEVVIPGKPGQMVGTITLTESDGTTTETVDMEIKVNIPLAGGKIEKLIADLLRSALKSENRTGREYLAG